MNKYLEAAAMKVAQAEVMERDAEFSAELTEAIKTGVVDAEMYIKADRTMIINNLGYIADSLISRFTFQGLIYICDESEYDAGGDCMYITKA